MKNYNFLIPLTIPLLFFSCKDSPAVPEEEIDAQTTTELILSTTETKLFQSLSSSGETVNLDENDMVSYFGKRISLFVPVMIKITKDSVYLHKQHEIIENYRAKWEEEDKLYIYADRNEEWVYFGERTAPDTFLLDIGFYSRKSSGDVHRTAILGQEYAVTSYEDLFPNTTAALVWLQLQATYQEEL